LCNAFCIGNLHCCCFKLIVFFPFQLLIHAGFTCMFRQMMVYFRSLSNVIYFRVSRKGSKSCQCNWRSGPEVSRPGNFQAWRWDDPCQCNIIGDATKYWWDSYSKGGPTNFLSLSLSLTHTHTHTHKHSHTIGGHCFLSQNDHRNLLVSLSVFVFQE
jgi:hypothetical protein